MSSSDRGYGRLYVTGGVTAQALDATPGTFSKLSAWATAGARYGSVPTAGSTDSIDLAGSGKEPADIRWSISFTVGAAGLFRVAPFAAGIVLPGSEQQVTAALSTVYTLAGTCLYIPTAVAEVIDLRAASDQISPNITVVEGWLEFRQ